MRTFSLSVFLAFSWFVSSKAQYQPLEISSGYNEDVIANGVGTAVSSTSIAVDLANFNFMSQDFQPGASTPPAYALPGDGLINSAVTPNLTFQMAAYSGNNSLRIATQNTSGTLEFANPVQAASLYLLTTSGSGTSTISGVITFDDNSTQTIGSPSIPDWYNSTALPIAHSGFGRVNRTTDAMENPAGNPRLYQLGLPILPSNQLKNVVSLQITKTSAADGVVNVLGVSALVVGNCSVPNNLQAYVNTTTSATVTWDEPVIAPEGYEYVVSTTAGIPTESGTPHSSTELTLDNLIANTVYYIYVRATCADDETSIWIGPAIINTRPGDDCSFVINLDDLTSPYSGTTTGATNNFSHTCSTNNISSDLYFSITVPVNYTLQIGQPENGYDSENYVAYGDCPGSGGNTTQIACFDDPDLTQVSFTNSTGTDQTIYWIQDGWSNTTNVNGSFTLAWTLTAPPSCIPPSGLTATPTSSTTATLAWTAPNPAGIGFEYYLSSTNAVPTENGEFTTSTIIDLEDLTTNATYYVFVRTDCDDDDYSTWIGPVTLTMPIVNDLCGGAISVACNGGPYTGSTATATSDNMPLCGYSTDNQVARGVWYVFEGNGDLVTASLCGSSYDTRLNIYSGDCGSLTCIAGNDDNAGACGAFSLQSQVSFPTVAGEDYYILVHGYVATSFGNYTLNITCEAACSPATSNDNCANALTLTIQPETGGVYSTVNNECALPSAFANTTCGNQFASHSDVFFTFNSGTHSAMTLDLSTVGLDEPVISGNYYWALYSGDCASYTYINCGTAQLNNTAFFSGLNPATNYILRIYNSSTDSPAGAVGNFNIMLTPPPPPPANDLCVNAVAFPEIPTDGTCATVVATTQYASGSADATCFGTEDDDVWFTFTVPVGYTSLMYNNTNVGGTSNDRMLQVLSTCGGTSLGCYDPESGYLTGLTGGTTYYLRVYTYGADVYSNFSICLQVPPPPPANDECASAIAFPEIPTDGTCATVQATTLYATGSTDATCFGAEDDDVWFTFTVPAGYNSVLYTNTSVSGNTDRMLQVLSACGGTSLGCYDPESGTLTGLTGGTTYYLRAYTYGTGVNSTFNICLQVPPPPPTNDECAEAIAFPEIPIDGTCATVTVNTMSASGSSDATCFGNEDDDVWFTFTVPDGYTSLMYNNTNIGGSSSDRMIQVLTACGGASLGCYDPESGTLIGLTGGATYYLRTYTYGTGVYSNYNICLRVPPPPVTNDEPCTAMELLVTGECSYINVSNVGATNSANANIPAPGCGGYQGGDVWFVVVVPENGRVIIDGMPGTLTDAALAIYSGDSCGGTLQLIECDDDDSENGNMPFIDRSGLVPGSLLYIRMWEYNNDVSGTFEICVTTPCTAPGMPTLTTVGNTITATWPSAGEGSTYNWELRENGAAGSGPDGLVASGTTDIDVLTVTIEDLNYASPYQFYISTNCGTGVISAWSNGASITTEVLQGCTNPEACNYDVNAMVDNGSCIFETTTLYRDTDGDGFGDAEEELENCGTTAEGYVDNNTDCDDTDDTVWQSASLYIDADGDGYDSGEESVCYGDSIPTGYLAETNGHDCDDNDPDSFGPTAVQVTLQMPIDEVCDNSASFTLTGGSPAGGTWSGTGVTGSSFNPAGLAPGFYQITYTVAGDGICTTTGSQTGEMEIDDCTNIEELDANIIRLFPTFTNNHVTVVGFDLKEAVIMDAHGKRLNTVSLMGNNIVDMSTYAAGIYFIHVTSNTTTQMFKVVRVH
jgi:hypothetical protein